MKRYRQTCLPANARKIYFGTAAVVTVFVGIVMTVAAVSSNAAPWWERLLCVILPTTAVPAGFAFLYWLSALYWYQITDKSIRLFYGRLPYRRIRYEEYPTVLLTNAGRYYRGYSIIYPIEYTDAEGKRLIYPAITLLDVNYPMETVHRSPGMCDLDMRVRNGAYFQRVGICYEDALMELLRHTNGAVYVLPDVLKAHREMFDRVDKAFPQRLQVLTDSLGQSSHTTVD